jgi:hypothetical protein
MDAGSARIARLLAWCSDHGIHVDSRLQVTDNDETGISVFSREHGINDPATRTLTACDNQLQKPSLIPLNIFTVVSIPKTALLSVKSCSLSDHIPPEPYGQGANLALSLALYIEL